MRNLHKFILENNGIEVLRLFRDWERLQYRECDYKNHRIFTIRCLHNDLVPVSNKLKSTLRTERARKILRLAEKQLLQAILKSINSLLDNNAKQIELTRSQIAFFLPIPSYRKCQEFIEKVKELRFKKVMDIQVRKFNNLLKKGREYNLAKLSSHRQAGYPGHWGLSPGSKQAGNSGHYGLSSGWLLIHMQTGSYTQLLGLLLRQQAGRQLQPLRLLSSGGIKVSGRQAVKATPAARASPQAVGRQAFPSRQHSFSGREHSLPGLPRLATPHSFPNRQHSFPGREQGLPGRQLPGSPRSKVFSQTVGL